MTDLLARNWPIVAVNLLFCAQIVQMMRGGQEPQALMCLGYIVANAGLIWSTLR